MAYEFRVDAISGRGLRRIARQQLRLLGRDLHDRADAANGHHEARKCLKRLRALLMLARPAIGKARWAKLDRRLSDAAQALSGPRDDTVVLQTLEHLGREHGEAALGAAGRRLLRSLGKRPASANTAGATLTEFTPGLAKIGKLFDDLPLKAFDADTALDGLEADYAAGRRQLRHAYRAQTSEMFHALRKHVQRHWRHMHLFGAAWPSEFGARIELARTVSELLGREHDFWLLRERLDKDGAALDELCQQHQATLRAAAKAPLELLFAEPHEALRTRLAAYWSAASTTE